MGKLIKESVEEMPEEVRRAYESAMSQFDDNDRNGLPDVMEDLMGLKDQNKNGCLMYLGLCPQTGISF